MMVRVYRIDRGVLGKVVNFLKTPPLPVAAAFSPVNIRDNLGYLFRKNFFVLSREEEISRFRDPLGRDLVDGVYHIRHPKKAMTDCLLPANEFHRFIIREQIADIISYVRAKVNVRNLSVTIARAGGGSINVGAIVEGLPLEGEVSLQLGDSQVARSKLYGR